MAHILHRYQVEVFPRASIGTLFGWSDHAISTRRRRFTRTARQSAGLVSAGTACVRLGRRTAPAERARQIAVWGGYAQRREPPFEPAALSRPGGRSLLAGWCGAGPAGLQAGDPKSSLARRAAPAGPTSASRSAGCVFRPRRLSCRMRSLSGDGRHVDSRDTPFRTVPPD